MTGEEFENIFREHKDTVYRFSWRMAGPAAAEDIAQEVFLSLLRHPDRFKSARGPLRPFLLGVARNLALKRWRGESRWEELEDEHFIAQPLASNRIEVAEAVGRAVQLLPPLQREVLILAEYDELSLEEIGRVVDVEVGTVKSRLHRARENLRRMLAPFKENHSMRMKSHGTVG